MLPKVSKSSFLTLPLPYSLVFGGLLFVFLTLKWSLLQDCDTFYHVRAGQHMLAAHSLIRQDIFSFYTPAVTWNNYAWLSQIFMALIYKYAGLKGISLFYFVLITVIYTALFRQMEQRSNTKIAVLMSLFVVFNSIFHWHARPHIFTMLFLFIWQKILSDFQEIGNKKQLFMIPLSLPLWINLHGGALSGLLLLGIYFGGNFLQAFGSHEALEKTKICAGLLILCLLGSLLHPDGLRWWHSVFNLTSSKLIANHIVEFLPMDFHRFPAALNFFFVAVLIFSVSYSSVTLIEWLIFFVFAPMAFYSIRHMPLFVILTAPILARHAVEVFERIGSCLPQSIGRKLEAWSGNERKLSPKVMPALNLLFLGIMVTGTLYAVSPAKKYDFDSKALPKDAVNFALDEKIPGKLFASDEVGDYMLYRKPGDQVFIYGYNDVDGIDRFSDFLKVIRGRKGWEQILEKQQINWILAGTQTPFALLLERHPDWRPLYSDKIGSVFIKNISSNQAWIDKYPHVSLAIESSLA